MPDAFNPDAPANDPTVELVGEGKKFKTVADLAKGKLESDAFIEQLKSEMAGLRAELGQKVDAEKTLSDLKEEIRQMKENKQPARSTENTTRAVSADELKSLIATYVTESEQQKTSAANIVAANNAIVRHYGSLENAQKALKAKASELGLSVDDLKNTAAKSPTAFLRLVVPAEKVAEAARDISSSVNTSALQHTPSGSAPQEGTKEWYDNLRATKPKLYWSPEIQNAIFKAAQAGTYDYRAGLTS